MNIKFLPEETIRKISTGELINNSCDVLKELLENSLDANSLNIKIEILNNGLDLIRVSDDGIGIKKKDLPLSIQRYTTSKIFFFNDLNKIQSFGFRGISLSCISSISQFSISSKYKYSNNNYGWLLCNKKKKSLSFNLKPISHNVGTIVNVKNIFSNNINIRKKLFFLGKNEWFYIKKIINYFSLSNYKVNFFIYRDNLLYKNYINKFFNNKNNILNRIIDIYGKKFILDYQYINILDKYYSFKGYVFRNNNIKNVKIIFLNNRIISIKNLLYVVVNNFFLDLWGKNIFFSYILYFKIENKYININLCPKKSKINFLNPSLLFSKIYKNLSIKFFKKKKNKTKLFLSNNKNYFLLNFGNFINIFNQRFVFSIIYTNSMLVISDMLFIFYYTNILIFKKKYFFLLKIKKINKLRIFLPKKYFLDKKKIFFLLDNFGFKICYKNNYLLINSVPIEFINLNLKKFFLSFLFFLKKYEKKKFFLEFIIYWLSNYIVTNNGWNEFNAVKLICKFHNLYIDLKHIFNKKLFYFLNLNKLFLYFNNNIWL